MTDIIYKIIFLLFFLIIFYLIPIYIIIIIIRRFYLLKISKNWLIIKGKIIKSEFKKVKFNNYITNIEYSFEVNKKIYIGKRLFIFSPFFLSNKKKFRLFEKYYLGKEIDIIYNEKKPNFSFIERSETLSSNIFILLLSLILIISGIIISIFIFNKYY